MDRNSTIALLGGGQLGRMFIENALRYPVRVHTLDPDPDAPCCLVAHRSVRGDLTDPSTVIEYARNADVVGIEIEHVSVDALRSLKAMGKRVIPDPDVLEIIQDKGRQKMFYLEHGLPTAPFALVEDQADMLEHQDLLPAFLKARTGGYDGKGVMALASETDIVNAFQGPCVLEQQVDIQLELAVLVVRDEGGAQVIYDPVEMVFDPRFNLVDHLRAPARVPASLQAAASQLAARVAEAFGAPGLYAVELFLTKQGELLVNETAPRAHNSGHHTIEACASSQFDQLLRVYMGWPLGDTTLRSPAAMINLVGEGGQGVADIKGINEILARPGVFIHLYGKKETRTGRKMGHVTVTGADDDQLDAAIAAVKMNCSVTPIEKTRSINT